MLYRPDGRLAAGSTTETAADIAEDFNLGSCGHRASPEEAVVDPRAGKVLNRMDYALICARGSQMQPSSCAILELGVAVLLVGPIHLVKRIVPHQSQCERLLWKEYT